MASPSISPIFHHTLFPLLKGIAITGSLFNASSSTQACRLLPSTYPTIQQSLKLGVSEWAYYYHSLSATVPAIDLTTILICGGLAYFEREANPAGLEWKLWATATGLMPVGWLWVWILMLKPSDRLLNIADAEDSVVDEPKQVVQLLQEWNRMFAVRAGFPWAVGALGLWAVLSR